MGYNYWPKAYPRFTSNAVEVRMSDYNYKIMTSQQSFMIVIAHPIAGELLFVKQVDVG